MTHRTFITTAIFLSYYALAWYGLSVFESGLLLTSLVLFGFPAYALARFSAAPGAVMVAVILFGATLGIFLEGIAHVYGLWYTIGIDAARLFGLVPIEAIAATSIQVLFLALLYEALFDDGVYTVAPARMRLWAFAVLALTVAFFVAIEAYIGARLIESPYQWIVSLLLLACFLALVVYRALTIRFLDRLVYFSFVAAVPLGVSLSLALTNVHKVFGHVSEYAYTYSWFGELVPIEELALILTMPLLVATVYEIYLDDIG